MSIITPLRELTRHMRSHSVTCHPAEVTLPPLPQPKLVLDLATRRDAKLSCIFFCGIDMERTYVSVTLRVGEDAAVKGYGDNCGDCGAGQQQQQPSGPAGYQCCPVSDTIKVSLTVDRGGAGVDRPRASPECPGRRCRAPPADKTPRQPPAAVNSERAR